jgi:hypothetical protein
MLVEESSMHAHFQAVSAKNVEQKNKERQEKVRNNSE